MLRHVSMTLVALALLCTVAAQRAHADWPPEPIYDVATIDGSGADWGYLDYFADFFRDGDPAQPVEGGFYLRYDCDAGVLYTMALARFWYDTYAVADLPPVTPLDAYVEIDGERALDGGADAEGALPAFAWTDLDDAGELAFGWEGAFALPPGEYELYAHTIVLENEELHDAATMPGRVAVQIVCPAQAKLQLDALVSVDGGDSWEAPAAAPGTEVPACAELLYQVEVTNTGDLPLASLALGDDLHDLSACELPAELAPGAAFTCTLEPFLPEPGSAVATACVAGQGPAGEQAEGCAATYYVAAPPTAGTVGGLLWLDGDGDGAFDSTAGEQAMGGVAVELLSCAGEVLGSVVSDDTGGYAFEGLAAGCYQLQVESSSLPAGAELSTGELPATVELPPCGTVDDVNFGYRSCGDCAGGLSELTLRFVGQQQERVAVLVGRRPLFTGRLSPDEIFSIELPLRHCGRLHELKLFVGRRLDASVAIDCSRPVGPGLLAGSFEVVAGTSRQGGDLCPLPADDPAGPGCACHGHVRDLALRYTGPQAARVRIYARCALLFRGWVEPGEVIAVQRLRRHARWGAPLRLVVDGRTDAVLSTRCRGGIGVGMPVGSFEIASGSSRHDRPLCSYTP